MKTSLLLSVLLVFCTAMSFAQNKMQLVGTWKLISGKMTQGDSTYNYGEKTSDAIKIVTPTHFAVFSQGLSDSSFEHAVVGTVQMDDQNYEEHIMYSNTKQMIGQDAKFTYHVEGDKWYVKGGIGNMMMFDEVWQRMK